MFSPGVIWSGVMQWSMDDVSCHPHPVTILGSEHCQSISLQNLLSTSQVFQGLWLNTVNWGCKAAAVILPDYCSPHNLPFMSLCPDIAQGYKVKVQSENISASHFSSQPVMMTGWLVSGIVYAHTIFAPSWLPDCNISRLVWKNESGLNLAKAWTSQRPEPRKGLNLAKAWTSQRPEPWMLLHSLLHIPEHHIPRRRRSCASHVSIPKSWPWITDFPTTVNHRLHHGCEP